MRSGIGHRCAADRGPAAAAGVQQWARKIARRTRRGRKNFLRCSPWVTLLLLGWMRLGSVVAVLQFDVKPDRVTNQRTATFTYSCTPIDGTECGVEVRMHSRSDRNKKERSRRVLERLSERTEFFSFCLVRNFLTVDTLNIFFRVERFQPRYGVEPARWINYTAVLQSRAV